MLTFVDFKRVEPLIFVIHFVFVLNKREADNIIMYRSASMEKKKEMFAFIAGFEGEVPGASAKDCGNYLDMNLTMAKFLAHKYLNEVINNISEDRLVYPQ